MKITNTDNKCGEQSVSCFSLYLCLFVSIFLLFRMDSTVAHSAAFRFCAILVVVATDIMKCPDIVCVIGWLAGWPTILLFYADYTKLVYMLFRIEITR